MLWNEIPIYPLVLAYLIGSVPFGLLVAKAFNIKDLRTRGSGNIGATNVTRVVGLWPAGVMVFCLDVLKGVMPVLILKIPVLQWLSQSPEVDSTMSGHEPFFLWLAGLFAVLGHCYSPWLHFRGGKGVATGFGTMLVLSPLAALMGALGFCFVFLSTRTSSLSSLTGLIVCSLFYLIFHPIDGYLWIGGMIILVIMVRHESNIDAILSGREARFNR